MVIKTFLSKINFFKISFQYLLTWNTYINNLIHKRIHHSILAFVMNSRYELRNLDFTYTVIAFHDKSRILNNNEKKLSFKEKISKNYYVDSKRLKYNSKRSYLYKPMEYNKIIKRTMFKQALQTAIPKIYYSTLTTSTSTTQRSYATYRVNVPKPITPQTSKIASQNNPEVLKTDTKGNSYTTRHNEVLKSTCDQDQCKEKVCSNPCGKPSGEQDKAIAHLTTNSNHANFVVSNNTDLDGNKRIQYGKSYSEPHEVNPWDVQINKRRSTNLNKDPQALKNINDNDFDK